MDFKLKKGITPIVSVVLLLLLTIALAGGVMVWLTGYTGGLQQEIQVQSSTCLDGTNTDEVDIRTVLYNAGEQEIQTSDLNLSYLTGPSTLNGATSIDGNNIAAGQQEVITFTMVNDNSGTDVEAGTYRFDVMTSSSTATAAAQCP